MHAVSYAFGAQLVKQVALRTSELAGDGTTTATLLAQAIVKEGAKAVAASINPMDIKRGIEMAVNAVVANIRKRSRISLDQRGDRADRHDLFQRRSRDRPDARSGDAESGQRV